MGVGRVMGCEGGGRGEVGGPREAGKEGMYVCVSVCMSVCMSARAL
jgi:hypothetical protein